MKMKKLKVVIIVGTRPEIIRLSSVIKKFDRIFNLKLIHTGQNYDFELNDVFFKDLGIRKPDYFLSSKGSSTMDTIGRIISLTDDILKRIQPDALLILGDTNSCLSAYPAKRRKIPIFHMEAGNRCFDERVPEEINRKIVDHISDINLTYSNISRSYLIREGILPQKVIKVGSPMFEVIQNNLSSIERSLILDQLEISKDNFLLFSLHREENVDNDKNLSILTNFMNSLSDRNEKVLISVHPRTKIAMKRIKFKPAKNIVMLKPLGFFDYCKLQQNAKTVFSDSGTIYEESSILNLRAVNIRNTNERPEAMEEAQTIMSGVNTLYLEQAYKQALDLNLKEFKQVNEYKISNVSSKVANIVLSHLNYVNEYTWRNNN